MSRGLKGEARFTSAHWGNNPTRTWDVNDPDLPDELVQMGRLKGFVVETFSPVDRVLGEEVEVSTPQTCHLTFTADTAERLYVVLDAKTQARLKRELWAPCVAAGLAPVKLASVARQVGGRQAKFKHANVSVIPLGFATDVYYSTHKKGDGPSTYHHELGEESGVKPALCVDAKGRLWLAGGNYTVPDAGITD